MLRCVDVLFTFLRLGLTSFGGPVAHLGYFRHEFVHRRRWLSDEQYADLVALCQFLPGPASSQVGMAIGLRRAGHIGLLAAWLGFTLPSAVALTAFALLTDNYADALGSGWLQGMKAAAVAVVTHALWGMARTLAVGRTRGSIALVALAVAALLPTAGGQITAIALGGVAGLCFIAPQEGPTVEHSRQPRGAVPLGLLWLSLFALLLLALPLLGSHTGPGLELFERFYRAGALVFGGGHVVLPLLQAEVVTTGLVDRTQFLAGYGAAQAIPGPLFAFSAYLGALTQTGPSGIAGATLALTGIFLPSALLIAGVLPFWDRLRAWQPARRALAGVNAAVVGLLAAVLWNPVLPAGASEPRALALAATAFALLALWRVPAWAVVVGAAGAGALFLG